MNRLCILAGTAIFGILGGLVATLLGMDMLSLGNFCLSGVGSVIGVYIGWKVAQHYK